ncbi:MAG: phosphotransferase family protein [Chloroflexota bacterium]
MPTVTHEHVTLPDPELAALAERLPAPVVRATRVGTLPGDPGRSLTLRLDLADGTRCKARLLETRAHADRVERLLALLDPHVFPQLLDRTGRATIEPWVDGDVPADPRGDVGAAARLGAILGAVHATPAPDLAGADRRPPEARLEPLRRRLGTLVDDRLIEPSSAADLAGRAEADLPEPVAPVIVHRDLAPENAIRTADGSLRIIDNTTLDERPPDYDLARTWYRWPMDPSAAAAFDAAYRGWRTPPARGTLFWRIDVLVEVIDWRRGAGHGGIERALGLLRALAAPGASA